MKPAWDQLDAEYAGSSVLIGDVDCTVETELCSEKGVSGCAMPLSSHTLVDTLHC